jgi:hypothetical protein
MLCDARFLPEHMEQTMRRVKGELQEDGYAIVAATTYGDVMANEEYVGWERDSDGRRWLYCRKSEEDHLRRGKQYHALGETEEGMPWAGEIRFADIDQKPSIVDANGDDVSDRLRSVFTGPWVVWEGGSVDAVCTAFRWRSDLRHVLTYPHCPTPTGGTMLPGEADLMGDPSLLRNAVLGDLIRIPLTWHGHTNGPERLPEECVKQLVQDAKSRGYAYRRVDSVQIGVTSMRAHARIRDLMHM